MKDVVSTAAAPPPAGSYSQAVRWGDQLLISGQTPRRLDGTRMDGPFDEQSDQVYANVRALAEAGGAEMDDALRVTVYLRDAADAAAADAAFARAFAEPRPARTTIVCAIAVAIEVDAIFGVRVR
jgi:2-iminobutanoate/2-iminopropanoate deaminase